MSPPPGYVAYGTPGAYGGTPARIGGLTKALVVLSIIGVAASAVALLIQLVLRDKAIDYLNRDISKAKFRDDLTPYLAAIFVAGVVLFAALIVQIIWTFRMARNLKALGRPSQSFSPGVTIAINILGGCTLGILPYFMWRELWKGSDPTVAPGDPEWKRRPILPILHFWLAATLLTAVTSFTGGGAANAFTRVNSGSESSIAKDLDSHFGYIIAGGVFGIITTILFIVFVREVAARHMQATREA